MNQDPQLSFQFKNSVYEVGKGYRYAGKIVQVTEIKDGIPEFKTLNGTLVIPKGGYMLRAPAYDAESK